MEDIYVNVESGKVNILEKKSTDQTGPRSSEKTFHAVVLCLGLLSIFLLTGLIVLCVTYVRLSSVKSNLTESLQISNNKLSSLTEELNRLNADLSTARSNLTDCFQISDSKLSNLTEELNRLSRTCPAGWTTLNRVCYFISTESGSWEKGREDCRNRGADLVVIKSNLEQTFLTDFINGNAMVWIGLTDRDSEGTWMWIDGSPLSKQYWRDGQPDNGLRHGEEDCAHIRGGDKDLRNWNDLPCGQTLRWFCQKMV